MIEAQRREIERATDDELLNMDQQRIEEFINHYDCPTTYVKGRLRCMDRSLIPGRFRFLFDHDGMFTGNAASR